MARRRERKGVHAPSICSTFPTPKSILLMQVPCTLQMHAQKHGHSSCGSTRWGMPWQCWQAERQLDRVANKHRMEQEGMDKEGQQHLTRRRTAISRDELVPF